MHLQVAAIVGACRYAQSGFVQHVENAGATHEVCPKRSTLLDIGRVLACLDGALDEIRAAGSQDLEHDALGFGTDVRNLAKCPVRLDQRLDLMLEVEYCIRRALITETRLPIRLGRRHVAEQATDTRIGVLGSHLCRA